MEDFVSYDIAVKLKEKGFEDKVFNRIYLFEYKSHEYIMFRSGLGNNSVAGVVHDPDCKCKEDYYE